VGPAEARRPRARRDGVGAGKCNCSWSLWYPDADWVNEAFDEYAKRMPRDLRIELIEVRPEPRSGGKSTAQLLDAEGGRLSRAVPRGVSARGAG